MISCDCWAQNTFNCCYKWSCNRRSKVFFLAAVLDRIYLTLLWLPNIDFYAFIFALIIDRERDLMKHCWVELETSRRQTERSVDKGGDVVSWDFMWCWKGENPWAAVCHFSTGFKTLEFFLQTFQYWSESYYIMSWFRPAWMYVVSMLVEHISSFARFGKRRTMFSTDLKLWQEGNKDSLLHNDKAALPKLKSCQ